MKRMLTHVDEMSDEQRSDMAGRRIGLIQFIEAEGVSTDAMKRAHTLMVPSSLRARRKNGSGLARPPRQQTQSIRRHENRCACVSEYCRP